LIPTAATHDGESGWKTVERIHKLSVRPDDSRPAWRRTESELIPQLLELLL
jgi:hypothetical protein